ncbi:S8 family serine peptidase [Dyadobacter subterraneus]|uniref:S8 family serine peptidase n=1 Tax=Dyadobacter subterraneus TaxID=2773304 RepID=A0ABR9W852_9BACT|nr:S8 family serine peptidase [Dyadobacter subterraneus]MBE9461655.1 S8 family serine peptidase [Dyadobacter subterraneus]
MTTNFYSFCTISFRIVVFVFFLGFTFENALAQRSIIQHALPPSKNKTQISGQYIVIYKDNDAVNARMASNPGIQARQQLMQRQVSATLSKHNISQKKILHVYETAIKGFSVSGLTNQEADQLRKDDQIERIEPDRMVYLNETSAPRPMAVASGCNGPVILFNGLEHFAGLAEFGSTANITGEAVVANSNGCGAITNVSGKVAVIDRGSCAFVTKVLNAQNGGAIAAIIINNAGGSPPLMAGEDATITIPAMSLSQADGNLLKAAINGGVTMVTLDRALPTAVGPQCTPWGITRIGGSLPAVTGRKAWIIDTGIDFTHPDLNVNTTQAAFFVGSSANDENGHGSHVAGIIGAKDNGFGVVGVAAGAEVVPVRVFAATGNSAFSIIIAGVNYVAGLAGTNDVVNMSLGGEPSNALDAAVRNLATKCKVVISAGNDAVNAEFRSPARVNAPNVYTISAMDINGALAGFSNFGNAPVDYSAPGVSIASCYKDGQYTYLDGTSMAAPHVTGILMLGDIGGIDRVTGDPDGKPDVIARRKILSEDTNHDGDAYTVYAGDPDDYDASVYPNAPELCDGKDNNGNGQIDEGTVCCPAGNTGILYVNAAAGGNNSGTSWPNAFTSLQSALSAAKYCGQITEIWVAKGTYVPTMDALGNTNPADQRTKTFRMTNNLAIYGGFVGNEPSNYNLALRNFDSNETVLSGNLQFDGTASNNAYNVILNLPPSGTTMDNTAILDGFSIQDGYASQLIDDFLSFPASYGGGILNYGSDVTVRNAVFYNNLAYVGGGMENQSSNPVLKNDWFVGNYGADQGGAIDNRGSSPNITNSSFLQNRGYYGAGITNVSQSNPVLLNCSFSGNTFTQNGPGGAIYHVDNSSSNIQNSILWGDNAEIVNETPSNTTISYSIVQGGWSGTGSNNLNVDPRFVSQPVLNSGSIGNIALLACSPAINAGNASTTTANVGNLDLAGNNRIFNNRVDMGAYEFQAAPFLVTISANPGLTVTAGQSTTLTASGADTYLWSTSATTPQITVSPTGATQYTVTGTSGACSMAVSATVNTTPLPVSLVSFSAKKQANGSVSLDWVTTNEINNAQFVLERSKDLKNIETIAEVNPDESTAATHLYQYTDELPYQGTSYYRLKQVDLDGHTTVYRWVSIVIDQTYAVFPNPVINKQFKLNLDEPNDAVIEFFSVDGHLIPLHTISRSPGMLELKLHKNSAPGAYILKVEERGVIRNYRVVVQ